MNLKITTNDLFEINNVAKALKQRDFIWINNILVGLDDPMYEIMSHVDVNKMSVIPFRGIAINQKELSKFCKSVVQEHEFIIKDVNRVALTQTFKTQSENLNISMSNYLDQQLMQSMVKMNTINGIIVENDFVGKDMTLVFKTLEPEAKINGIYTLTDDPDHIMYIPANIIQLNKTDKIYMTIIDTDDKTFLVRFKTERKSYDVYSYFNFVRLPKNTRSIYNSPYYKYHSPYTLYNR